MPSVRGKDSRRRINIEAFGDAFRRRDPTRMSIRSFIRPPVTM
jgi:hypothetical protein